MVAETSAIYGRKHGTFKVVYRSMRAIVFPVPIYQTPSQLFRFLLALEAVVLLKALFSVYPENRAIVRAFDHIVALVTAFGFVPFFGHEELFLALLQVHLML